MEHGPYRPGTTQAVDVGAASAAITNAVGSQTYQVRLIAQEDCHVEFGAAPTAVAATSMFLAANREEVFSISPGEKVAVIQNAAVASKNLYVTELSHG